MAARDAELSVAAELVKENKTLFDAALRMTRIADLQGRGVTPVVELAGGRCVVRHFRRGGSVASALGDRYLRASGNRVLQELRASVEARGRGVATPEVKVAAWYDVGIFRRYDIATSYIPSAGDLSDVLFDDAARAAALSHATLLLRQLISAGMMHRDLNLKNILVTDERAYVIDLDRAEVFDRLTQAQASAMRDRMLRSLTKWEAKRGRSLPASTRTALGEAFVV